MSALAVVSLVFGLISPVCVAHPFFMVIPLVGAATAIVAIQRIAASEGALAGRWAAIAGLALCVTSALATMSYGGVTRILRTNQAKAFAQNWLDLLAAGKTEQAFRLTVDSIRRPAAATPHEPEPKTDPFDEFTKNALIQSITAAGADARVQYVETVDYQPIGRRQYFVTQQFTVTPAATANRGLIEVLLTLQRSSVEGETQMRWLVGSYEAPGATADTPPSG